MIYLRYLRYVIRHKWFVLKACLQGGLRMRGLLHDLSKFRASEFVPYARYFYGDYGIKYPAETGATEQRARVQADFDRAWLLHIHRNAHHWEYWLLYDKHVLPQALDMPDRYIKEMICDWYGAGAAQGKRQRGEVYAWYQKNKAAMRLSHATRLRANWLVYRKEP